MKPPTTDQPVNECKAEPGVVLYGSPDQFSIHPAIKTFPWGTDEEMATLRDDISDKKGVIQPVLCTSKFEIYDGRHRHKAARELGLKTIPYIIDDSKDPVEVAFASCLARRQLSSVGRALTLFEGHPQLLEQRASRGRKHQLAQMKTASEQALADKFDLPSFASLAAKYRIVPQYFTYLAAIYDSCESDDEWADYRGKLLAGEVSLQAAYAGLRGKLATLGKERNAVQHYAAIEQVLIKSLPRALKHWAQLDVTDQHRLIDSYTKTLSGCPKDAVLQIAKHAIKYFESLPDAEDGGTEK